VRSALQQMQQVQAMLASQARTQTSGHDGAWRVSLMHTGLPTCAGGGAASGLCAYGSGDGIGTGGSLYGQVGFRGGEVVEGRSEAEGVPSTDELFDLFERARAGRLRTWSAALCCHHQQQQQLLGPALYQY
jgi:hypothetical protein